MAKIKLKPIHWILIIMGVLLFAKPGFLGVIPEAPAPTLPAGYEWYDPFGYDLAVTDIDEMKNEYIIEHPSLTNDPQPEDYCDWLCAYPQPDPTDTVWLASSRLCSDIHAGEVIKVNCTGSKWSILANKVAVGWDAWGLVPAWMHIDAAGANPITMESVQVFDGYDIEIGIGDPIRIEFGGVEVYNEPTESTIYRKIGIRHDSGNTYNLYSNNVPYDTIAVPDNPKLKITNEVLAGTDFQYVAVKAPTGICNTGADDPNINPVADCNYIVDWTEINSYVTLWIGGSVSWTDINLAVAIWIG